MDTRTDATVPGPVSADPEMDVLGRFYQDGQTCRGHLTIRTGRSAR